MEDTEEAYDLYWLVQDYETDLAAFFDLFVAEGTKIKGGLELCYPNGCLEVTTTNQLRELLLTRRPADQSHYLRATKFEGRLMDCSVHFNLDGSVVLGVACSIADVDYFKQIIAASFNTTAILVSVLLPPPGSERELALMIKEKM